MDNKNEKTVEKQKTLKLTKKKQKALQLLIEGELGKAEIAKEIGVHRQTLWKWEKDPLFAAELQRQTEQMKTRAINYLNNKALVAAKKYWELTDCADNRTKANVLEDVLNRSIGKANTPISVEETTSEGFDLKAALAEIKAKMGE